MPRNQKSRRPASLLVRSRKKGSRPPPKKRDAGYGISIRIEVVDFQGPAGTRRRTHQYDRRSRHPGRNPIGPLLTRLGSRRTARALAALGHARRLSILQAMLSGAATHAELKRRARMGTGPLYFHLRGLERAGLVHAPERNRYEAAPLGRTLACALGCILRDANGGKAA